MEKVKVIIAGGRDFDDYEYLYNSMYEMHDEFISCVEIVSGMAKGADSLGEKFAEDNGLVVHKFPADWKNKGKAAGPIRNREMAEFADELVVFWDGESRGTANMISEAKRVKMPTHIYYY